MKKHKRYHNQIKDDKQKEYDEMESSQADMKDFRRPPYAVKRMIQARLSRSGRIRRSTWQGNIRSEGMRLTKEMLQSYRSKKDEIAELDWVLRHRWPDEGFDRKQRHHGLSERVSAPAQCDRGSTMRDMTGYKSETEREKAILLTECEEVEEWIEQIPDSLTRRIFKMTYIEGRKQKAVAESCAFRSEQSKSKAFDEYLKEKCG